MGVEEFLFSILVLASASAGAVPGETSFEIEGGNFSMAIPQGMCPTEASNYNTLIEATSSAAGKVAAAFAACDAKQEPFIFVYIPDLGTAESFDREEALDGLALAYTASGAPKYDPQMQSDLARNFEHETGRKVSAPGTFDYIGRDADCVYLAGKLDVSIQAKRLATMQIGACLTAVGGKMIFVYAVIELLATTSDLQELAHDAAMSIRRSD